jgi:beta-mannosidase
MSHPIHDGWTVRPTAGPVPERLLRTFPAQVPGSVHTDLLAAGAIGDPYLDANEQALTWMHDVDWRYERALTLEPAADDERVDLAFDGLDTVATVAVDVRHLTDRAARRLTVDLRSATAYALELRDRLGGRPSAYPTPFNFVRKMASSFGWDWGPDLRTAGIWKPVRVERWRVARLAQVRPLVTVGPDGTGRVELHVTLERSGLGTAQPVDVTAQVLGRRAQVRVAADETSALLVVEVPEAPLWWPAGYGAQPLADLVVHVTRADARDLAHLAHLADAADGPLDTWTRRIGFRTVELDTSDDTVGTAFVLRVNGRPVFVKGANWIPDDHLLTRITPQRLARRLDQALGANLNLLRVWGGGVFESDDFYRAADERGLLVWQDFLLACAAYPEESPILEEIEAEARENVVRLASHPSLVIWNGGNENVWGHEDWGWKAELDGRTWGARYAHQLFRDVVAELDPTRPYTDNSPYSPRRDAADVHPNDPDHGTHHQWEVWNRVDYTAYRGEVPRFCSEFGFQGPPTWRTLHDWVHAVDGAPLETAAEPKDDPVFLVHQKAEDGNGKLDRGMAPHLGVPDDFTDWTWAAQLNQARAVAHAVEHYRSWWPRTAGAIVWQLNDCWPVTSWAAVDSQERLKPLWFALRRANAPRLLTLVERDGAPALAVVNDTDEQWTGTAAVRRESLAGNRLATTSLVVDVPARAVAVLPLPVDLVTPVDPRAEALVVTLDEVRTVHTFVEDVDLALDPDALEATVTPVDGGLRVDLVASSLVRDITLLVDRLDPGARVDDALVTLPAGATVSLVVTTDRSLDPAALTSAPVLRTANDLLAVRQRSVMDTTPAPDGTPEPAVTR